VPVLRAAADVKLAGLIVSVNRMERGTTDRTALDELAMEFSMPTRSIVNLDEILEHLGERLGNEDRTRIAAYRDEYGAVSV
jgi:orotate phosphoribosyltransferase